MTMFWKISVVVMLALCLQVFAQNKKTGSLGGWRDVDENDASVQDVLRFATEEYNKRSNDGYITDIMKIIRLRRQVVAGMKYSMEVEVAISPCSEDQILKEECQNQKAKKKRCSFEVVDIPWQKHRELTKSYCSTIRN